jgi:hypothetical protein
MENTKKYDTKKYYETFREKNKNSVCCSIVCEICGGKYSYFNKSHHQKSKKHLKALELNELKNKIKELENKILLV